MGSKRKFAIKIATCFCVLLALGLLAIRLLSIEIESGPCHGGFITSIFNMYNEELVELYYDNSEEKDLISDIKAIKGTQQGDWEYQTLFLEFDIEYYHKEKGVVKEKLHFVGKRVWYYKYKWTVGPIIEG